MQESDPPDVETLTRTRSLDEINRQIEKCISYEQSVRGVLRDADDIRQQVHFEWQKHLSSPDADPADTATLTRIINRVIRRSRYHQSAKSVLSSEVIERIDGGSQNSQQATIQSKIDTEKVDFQIDLQQGLCGFDDLDLCILAMRREGWTLQEIGDRHHLSKQRVSEIIARMTQRLSMIYSKGIGQ